MMTEHAIQVQFTTWIKWNKSKCPGLGLAFAIPNGGARTVVTGSMLKSEGVRKGVPDYCIPVASGGFHGLWIEFKTPKGRVSTDQADMMDGLRSQGYCCEVARSLDDAIKIVENYLK